MARLKADAWADGSAETCKSMSDASFQSLSRTAPPHEHRTQHFALPGYTLIVQSVGKEVSSLLTAAFSHLAIDTPANDKDTLLWRIGDTSLTGDHPDFPPPPDGVQKYGNFNHGNKHDLFVERRQGLVSVYDHNSGAITSISCGAAYLENDQIAKPLLRFLLGILLQKGIYLAHAALVGLNGRGLLVTGKGGMGKSTISSTALRNGYSFCSDDFVALQRVGDEIVGHSLYSTLMLHPDQLPEHPHFEGHIRPASSENIPKSVVILGSGFRKQTVARLLVDGIAIPQITDAPHSELRTISRAAALRALTPTSVFSSPWREVERARFLMDLAANLPCFTYQSGSDFSQISEPLRKRYG